MIPDSRFIFLCTLITLSDGISRYFIEGHPRPLDICHTNSDGDYVKYSCIINSTQHTLTAANYGFNFNCDSLNPTITTYIQNISNTTTNISNTEAAEYESDHSFNCIGENNYGIVIHYNDELSCDSSSDLTSNDTETLAELHANETDSDISSVQYFATNMCYRPNHSGPWLYCYYCNGFYITHRQHLGRADVPQYTWVISPFSCLDNNGLWSVMSECSINETIVTPETYMQIDNESISVSLSVEERIGLIHFYVSTSPMQPNGFMLHWAERCATLYKTAGMVSWDLMDITENGNILGADGITPICGLIVDAPHQSPMNQPYNPNSVLKDMDLGVQFYYYEDHNEMFNNFNETTDELEITVLGFNLTVLTVHGTIPESICQYFPNLRYLWVLNQYGLHGSLPSCLGELDLIDISVSKTNISGIIPDSLCNIKYFTSFHLVMNEHITGTIPECFGDMFFQSFSLIQMPGISGTIPDGIFGNKHMFSLMISENINLTPKALPNSFSETKPVLLWLRLSNINLIGTMPTFPKTLGVAWIELQHNQLKGSVSDIFGDLYIVDQGFQSLWTFSIHDNQFHDDDITDLMTEILDKSIMLIRFTLSNNKMIKGRLPDTDVVFSDFMQIYVNVLTRNAATAAYGMFGGLLAPDFSDIGTTALTLHGCSFYGTLPEKQYYVDFLTLHNNRLSGVIPQNFKKKFVSQHKASSILLLGQLLWTDSDGVPEWIDSPLTSAVNMYYTFFDQFTSVFVITIAFIGIISCIVCTLLFYSKRELFDQKVLSFRDSQIEHDQKVLSFFNTIAMMIQLFGKSWLLLSATVILIIFYAFTTKYYYEVPYETLFALPFYWIEDGHDSTFIAVINSMLTLLALIFHFAVANLVHKLNTITKKTKSELKTALKNSQNSQNDSFIKLFMSALFYFVLVLVEVVVIIMYILSSSLPENNILGLSTSWIKCFGVIISLVLASFNIFVIPRFATLVSRLISDGTKYKYGIILIVRLFNEIFLPFIASIYLLNDCGKYWINSWNYCVDDEMRKQFEIQMLNFDFSISTLLTADDVCKEPSLSDINYNSCLRSFLYHWTGVLMLKLIVATFMQIIAMFVKKFRQTYLSKYVQEWKEMKVKIDGEYIGITVNLLMSVTFSFTAPLIIPLTLLQIMCKLLLYSRMINKYKWEFIMKHAANEQTLPVHLVWIGVILNQFITLFFFIFCVGYVVLSSIVGVGFICIDIYFVYQQSKNKQWPKIFKKTEVKKAQREAKQENPNGYDKGNVMQTSTEMSAMNILNTNTNTMVHKWLSNNFNFSDLEIREYADIFVMNGFDSLAAIKEITSDDLKEIGIQKLGHRKLILNVIRVLAPYS